MRNPIPPALSIFRLSALLVLSAFAMLVPSPARADAPSDTPEVKALRDVLLDWDKNDARWTLEQERKCYHGENEKEQTYLDFVAHENWEEAKLQQAVRDKWGAEAEAKFAHFLGGSTLEDDQVCDIKVEGEHATVSWDNIKDSSPLKMIKVDGKWLVDGHAMFEEAVKDDPTKAPDTHPTGKLMKQAAADIADGKFDDIDEFMSDFKAKYTAAPDGN